MLLFSCMRIENYWRCSLLANTIVIHHFAIVFVGIEDKATVVLVTVHILSVQVSKPVK